MMSNFWPIRNWKAIKFFHFGVSVDDWHPEISDNICLFYMTFEWPNIWLGLDFHSEKCVGKLVLSDIITFLLFKEVF